MSEVKVTSRIMIGQEMKHKQQMDDSAILNCVIIFDSVVIQVEYKLFLARTDTIFPYGTFSAPVAGPLG